MPAKGSPLGRFWRPKMLNLGHLGHPRCSKWIPWGPLWGGKLVFWSLLGALFDQLLIWCHFWLIFGLIFEHLGAKFGSILAPTWTNDARKRMPRIHMKKQHVFNSKFMRRRCVRGEKMCVFHCKYQCFLNVGVSRQIPECI